VAEIQDAYNPFFASVPQVLFCPGVTRIRTKLNPDRNVGGAIVMEGFAAALASLAAPFDHETHRHCSCPDLHHYLWRSTGNLLVFSQVVLLCSCRLVFPLVLLQAIVG